MAIMACKARHHPTIPRALMAFNARCCPVGYDGMPRKTSLRKTSSDRYKSDDGIPRSMSFDGVWFPMALITCHTRLHPTMRTVTPNVVRLYVQCQGDDGMPRPISSDCGYVGTPNFTSFDRVCIPRAMMASHVRRSPTMRGVLGR
uniref:Uncharacterized protein n=1 Tax=Solanum lycopersicum TaxID=4081 RepID=A0A3Q7EV76_SOLLC